MSSFKEVDAKVEALMKQAFDKPREARSAAYKQGVRAALWNHFCTSCSVMSQCHYEPGTAEFDAFMAGTGEGHFIHTKYNAELLLALLNPVMPGTANGGHHAH